MIFKVEDDSSASPARKIYRSRTVSSTEMTEEQLRNIVSKILQVSWTESSTGKNNKFIPIKYIETSYEILLIKIIIIMLSEFLVTGTIYVPTVAAALVDNPKLSLDELSSHAIMDLLTQIADGSDPLQQIPIAVAETSKRLSEEGDDSSTSGLLGSESDADKGECPSPSLPIPKTIPTEGLAVSYLLRFYNNINLYQRDNQKKSSEPPLSDILQNLRTVIVNHIALVVRGALDLQRCPKSSLLPYVLSGNTPTGLIPELVTATYEDTELFELVRHPSSALVTSFWNVLCGSMNMTFTLYNI